VNYQAGIKYALILIALLILFTCCTPENANASFEAPTADFNALPLNGEAPQAVTFTSAVSGDVDSYYWDFGDGQTSKEKDPVHIYNEAGTYTVILVVNSKGGFDIEKKEDYVTVIAASEPPVDEFISWADAGKYIGEFRTVDGIIKSAYYASSKSSRPTFLNFNVPYEKYFTCLIWGRDRSKFVNAFHSTPESYLLHKHVRVTGPITEYPEGSGVPEMILTEPSQLIVLETEQ
jgi:PKD repeat protein